jgi:very-short-patch-repair endonuclease
MRLFCLFLLSMSLLGCATRKSMKKVVGFHNNTFPLQQLKSNIPATSGSSDIKVNSGFGLPAQTEVVGSGVLILPLLFYNHFQSSFQVVLGQDVLDDRWGNYVDKKLADFASALASSGIGQVKLEVTKAVAHGKYISGHAYVVTPSYYYTALQDINLSRSKNATAEVAITLSWTDNNGKEESREASIKLDIANNGVYSGQVRTLLGKTVSLSANDIKFHFDHEIQAKPTFAPNHPMMAVHLFRLSDLLVLGLDELCEVILMESKEQEVKPLPASYASDLVRARQLLWEKLRGRKLGDKFVRGYSNSGGFRSGIFYDFVCHKAGVTVDVGIERNKISVEHYLFSHGQTTSRFRHLYFSPEDVLQNTDDVVEKIKNSLSISSF